MSKKPTPEDQQLAAAYRECFTGTEAGKRVLADLMAVYPPAGPRFVDGTGRFVAEPYAAAYTDGQRVVTARIEALVKGGGAYRHE